MAAGPDMGSAGPRTCIQPDTNSHQGQSQPFRALANPAAGEEKACRAVTVTDSLSASSCPSSTRCHIVRHNAEELNSNFPV